MRKLVVTFVTTAAVIVGLSTAGWAQSLDAGKFEYRSSCAPCHGSDGKGKGPISSQLKVMPTDLTVLTKKNNGVFPFSAVYEIIDGRQAIIAHGTREMPIWGNRYTVTQIERSVREAIDFYYDPEIIVRTRVLAVIDYLNQIQEK